MWYLTGIEFSPGKNPPNYQLHTMYSGHASVPLFARFAGSYNSCSYLDSSVEGALVLLASFWTGLLNAIFLITGIFLILLVLVQRGRGGGLIGALGGAGGSSPFGSRAGDMFTRVTLVVAGFWILLAMIQIRVLEPEAVQVRAPENQQPQPQ